jgi:hypothetical protein
MVNLRKVSFYASGVIVLSGFLILLIWPELAGPLTMALIILAVGLGPMGSPGESGNNLLEWHISKGIYPD